MHNSRHKVLTKLKKVHCKKYKHLHRTLMLLQCILLATAAAMRYARVAPTCSKHARSDLMQKSIIEHIVDGFVPKKLIEIA